MSERGPTRRQVLKAAGVALALPWLDSLFPRALAAAAESPIAAPVRAAFVFVPNGMILPSFLPKEEGSDFALPPTLEPLESLRRHILIPTGLTLDNARAKGDGPGDHARAAAAFLTTAHPKKTAGRDIRLGISVDQLLAQKVGADTRLASLELGCTASRDAGRCDSGYSCAYVSNISWSGPTTPAPKEVNPRLVFERMFGAEDDRRSLENRMRRLKARRSILDFVGEDARRLGKRLGKEDRRKLEEYTNSVREVEKRIERAEADVEKPAEPGIDAPAGIPRDHAEHVRLMFDLAVLAFRTDLTRVVSFMVEAAGSNRSYPAIAVPEGHHQISHHQGDRVKIEKLARIDRFHVEEFARFVRMLSEVREGEGTLLDSSLVVFGSGIGDGNRHSHHDLPILLAGRGGGLVDPGRHVRYPKNTPLANLYLSILEGMGANVPRFGDGTGPLRGLHG